MNLDGDVYAPYIAEEKRLISTDSVSPTGRGFKRTRDMILWPLPTAVISVICPVGFVLDASAGI